MGETGPDIYIEVLDGSRIHPEHYSWARKMAVDALCGDEDEVSFKSSYKSRNISENRNREGSNSISFFSLETQLSNGITLIVIYFVVFE